MRVLIASHRPTPPFFFGGVEVNQRIIGAQLAEAGILVRYLGSYTHPRWSDSRRLPGFLVDLGSEADVGPASAARPNALIVRYSVGQSRATMVDVVDYAAELARECETWNPDLIVASCSGTNEIVRVGRQFGVPSLAWVQDVNEDGMESAQSEAAHIAYASAYLQNYYAALGLPTGFVLYPPFDAVTDSAPPTPDRTVLMINPIPEKGSSLLLALAKAMPDWSFTALTGWRDPEWALLPYPPNISILPRTRQTAPVYHAASVVIVPSIVAEGFGRVPVEAALHHRRALCHAVGALPEASGIAENLISDLQVYSWVRALNSMAGGTDHGLIDRARLYAERFTRSVVPEIIRLILGCNCSN